LADAQDEARRIAANNPGTDVWVIACETVATVRSASAAAASAPIDGTT
jgi:hypothetical protein